MEKIYDMQMKQGKDLVSIVAPVFNEEASIEIFLKRLLAVTRAIQHKYQCEIILVDDGSTDRSLRICAELATKETSETIRIVELRRNFGQTAALQAGLDQAVGEIVVTLDSDLQHFPEEIPKFLEKIEEGFDVVCGWRRNRKEGVLRRYPSRVANFLIRCISGVRINDFGTTFRAYRKDIIHDLRLLGEQHRFIPVMASITGAKIAEIPIENIERPAGQSNYGISRSLSVFLDLFYLYFNVKYMDRPLRAFGRVAILMMSLGMLIIVPMTIHGFWSGVHTVSEHIGWFALGVSCVIASINFLMTGLLGEILVRIYFSSAGAQSTFYKIRKVWGK